MKPTPTTASLLLAAATGLVAADAARACTACSWGGGHPTGGNDFAATAELYGAGVTGGGLSGRLSGGTQQVWLDFSQASPGAFSAAEQQAVLERIEDIYFGFDVAFSLSNPGVPATRLRYVPTSSGGSGFGGVADSIDFRNLDADNSAFIYTADAAATTSARQVNYLANVGAHELGHTLGLRHYDSFGPIGSGVPDTFGGFFGTTPIADTFFPDFDGPRSGSEFFINTMSTPALGGTLFFDAPTFLSERSLVKLQFAAEGQVDFEASGNNNSIGSAQPLDLPFLDVLNTRPAGSNAADAGDPYLPARAGTVLGSLSSAADVDVFAIDANAGDFLSVELISLALDQRISDGVDGAITVTDANGTPLDYYGLDAFNEDEVETFDAWILDLPIPETGTYFIEVDSFFSNNTGDYELYVSSYGTGRTPGDANGDGTVDLADFGILRANFGLDARFSGGDFSGDLLVDLEDFGILRANFGASADELALLDAWAATIPEPASVAALGLAALGLCRRRA